jgi:hypothetical protein
MKLRSAIPLLLLVACAGANGQVTFAYDQQSKTDETPTAYDTDNMSRWSPLGQSFTPALPSVGFVRLKFSDGDRYDALGATVYLNLRSHSLTGPILGTTPPATMPSQFRGTENFFFADGVPVTPGEIYYFEVVQQLGGAWHIEGGEYHYPGGSYWYLGDRTLSAQDLWFREGIVIPEPSAGTLLGFGLAGLLASRRAPGRR